MNHLKIKLSIFSICLVCSISNAESLTFKGSCLLNQISPDHTLAGREIINGKADVIFKNNIFTASYVDYDGERKTIASPKMNIKLNDGVMALSGTQWMSKDSNTYYVISNSLKMSFEKCTQ